jgi:hypothetical protein
VAEAQIEAKEDANNKATEGNEDKKADEEEVNKTHVRETLVTYSPKQTEPEVLPPANILQAATAKANERKPANSLQAARASKKEKLDALRKEIRAKQEAHKKEKQAKQDALKKERKDTQDALKKAKEAKQEAIKEAKMKKQKAKKNAQKNMTGWALFRRSKANP